MRDIDEAANVRFLNGAANRLEFPSDLKILEVKSLSELDDLFGQIQPPFTCYRHLGEHPSAYNNLPDVTAQVWRGGWYHSGDIGEIDNDGFFYFHGRMKEAIRRRGENISAWEISSVLDLHPKVQESAAFGIPSEDGEEDVMVSVVPQPNAALTPEELLDFCQGRLAYYAMPRYVDIVGELPKTSTQKIQHLVLKAKGRSETTWDREQARYTVQRA